MLARRGLILGLVLIATAALTSAAAMRATPAGAQDLDDSVTIPLDEYEGSGVSGTATLTAEGDGVRVTIELRANGRGGDHLPHIHTGTCADFDPSPLYPLTNIVLNPLDEGRSETSVGEISLDELLADDHLILVHDSREELPTYLVCGEIEAGQTSESVATAPPESAGVGGVGDGEMPVAGVGPIGGADGNLAIVAGLGMLALTLAGFGLWLRRADG